MNALLLLLLDSRSPAGGHNHSGGMEAAIEAGLIRGQDDVEAFCRTRLRTAGRVNAAFAAAACRLATPADDRDTPATAHRNNANQGSHRSCSHGNHGTHGNHGNHDSHDSDDGDGGRRGHGSHARHASHASHGNELARQHAAWADLDAELDARTPSAAMRDASRQLGRGLMRLVRASLADFAAPWATTTPHHPIVLGAAVAAAGGDAELAARAAALATVSVPMSGAVRLLGLDPFAAHAVLARLAPDVDDLAAALAHDAVLPAASAPALDLLADFHLTAEVRLFAS